MRAAVRSWISGADTSRFPLARLPLGVRRRPDGSHAACTRVGDRVADLRVLAEVGVFDDTGAERADLARPSLNALLARGRVVLDRVRDRAAACLDDDPNYWDFRQRAEIFLLPADQVRLVLPVACGDYTRFAHRAPGRWASREARAANLLVEGDADARLAIPFRGGDGEEEPDGLRPTIGIGVVIGTHDDRPFPYGLCGLADWTGAAARGADDLRPGRRTVVAPWITPLAALADDSVTVEATLTANGPARRERVLRREGERVRGAEMLAALRAEGAVVRAGDLLGRSVAAAAPPGDRWVREDAAALSVDAWISSAPG